MLPRAQSDLVPDARRGRVRVFGQENDGVELRGVRGVDAGGRADETVWGLRDHERRPRTQDPGRLGQDHLEPPRIAVAAGELDRILGGVDVRKTHHASLGLRHDLLGDTDDVAGAQLERTEDQAGEIVTRFDLRKPLDGEDLHHSRITPPVAASRTDSASSLAARLSFISVRVTCGRTRTASSPAAPAASAWSITSASSRPG